MIAGREQFISADLDEAVGPVFPASELYAACDYSVFFLLAGNGDLDAYNPLLSFDLYLCYCHSR